MQVSAFASLSRRHETVYWPGILLSVVKRDLIFISFCYINVNFHRNDKKNLKIR